MTPNEKVERVKTLLSKIADFRNEALFEGFTKSEVAFALLMMGSIAADLQGMDVEEFLRDFKHQKERYGVTLQ